VVSRGKSEQYLKDEGAPLEDYLISTGLDEMRVCSSRPPATYRSGP